MHWQKNFLGSQMRASIRLGVDSLPEPTAAQTERRTALTLPRQRQSQTQRHSHFLPSLI
ncbi:unnamed protein product, partial [Iphiclides podalirius]